MEENKERKHKEVTFKLGDMVDFDALLKKKGIMLTHTPPQEKRLDNKKIISI